MMMKVLLAVAALICVVRGQVVPPIPVDPEDPGISLDADAVGAPVKLEAFLELNCPDSDYSWPILKQLQEHYGPENINVVIHQVPLPYHRQAFLCTQGLNLVRDVNPAATIEYVDQIFDNILRFGGFITRNMNEREVIEMLAEIQEPATGISEADFIADFADYSWPTIKAWKYGTRRNVAGTPWFGVNNVDLAVNPSIRLSFNDWLEILDPLMPEETAAEEVVEPMLAKVDNQVLKTVNAPKQKVQIMPVEDNIKTLTKKNVKKPAKKLALKKQAVKKPTLKKQNVPKV